MPTSHVVNAQAWIDRANQCFAQGNLAEARLALRAAFQLKPACAELSLALGHIELQLQDLPQSRQCYATASRLKPNWPAAHASHALVLQLMGYGDEARNAAQEALALDPLDRVALLVLAHVHFHAGRHAQARALCRRILDRNPQDREALQLLGRCRFDLSELHSDWPPSLSGQSHGLATEHGHPAAFIQFASNPPFFVTMTRRQDLKGSSQFSSITAGEVLSGLARN